MSLDSFDCVVAVSGGKDSQACLKLAAETIGIGGVVGLFCDTKFEHPKTYSHIDNLELLYGVPIVTISNGSVLQQIRKYKRFPSALARFCTYNLKIAASRDWYLKEAKRMGHGFQVWLGVRAAESTLRAKRYSGRAGNDTMPLHEFMPKNYPKSLQSLGVIARLPIIEWSEQDVFSYLNGEENPLYKEGFSRVGCFPCLAAGDAHKNKAFSHDDIGKAHYVEISVLEKELGKSAFSNKKHSSLFRTDEEFSGCSICAI